MIKIFGLTIMSNEEYFSVKGMYDEAYLKRIQFLERKITQYEQDPVSLIRGRFYPQEKMKNLRKVSQHCEIYWKM
jgi:hypothetical protein